MVTRGWPLLSTDREVVLFQQSFEQLTVFASTRFKMVRAVREVSQGRTFLTPKVSDIVLRGFLNVENKGRPAADSEVVLTPRENEILRLLAGGKSNKEISAVLGITVWTVETHRAKIMLKLDLHSIAGLIHYALGKGLTDFPLGAR